MGRNSALRLYGTGARPLHHHSPLAEALERRMVLRQLNLKKDYFGMGSDEFCLVFVGNYNWILVPSKVDIGCNSWSRRRFASENDLYIVSVTREA